MKRIYFNDLKSQVVTLKRPIPINFRQYSKTATEPGYFLVSVEGANLFGSGDDLEDACDYLKNWIVESYLMLKDFPDERLGKSMKKQKQVLLDYCDG